MKRSITAASLALLLIWSLPALAREPLDEEGSEPSAPTPDPAPLIAPPPGLYYVTDTYVADVVTTTGPLTTYSTATVHESTGSYARVLETVGTGESSAYDGGAFNGRRTFGDGRSVAGTYYENYVVTADGFMPVSIVFFQDDAELARLLAGTPPSAVRPLLPMPSPTTGPLAPACCAAERPVPIAGSTPVVARPIKPGVSLLPVSSPLTRFEVLRGRAVGLWLRAFVDDREVSVRSWTVVAGEAGDADATAGPGSVPFRTSWRRLAPPGAAHELVFRIEVETPETGHRTVDTAIVIVVRSPALEA